MPSTARAAADDRFQIGEPILDQFEPALRLLDETGAVRDRALIAIDADHARAGRRQDRARIAAGAERRVDVESAVAHAEPFDGAAGEHGNVTSRSASDSVAVAARHHSRAPGGFSAAAIRVPSSCLKARTFSVASANSAAKAAGLPDLKFVTETDERHRVGDPRMGFEGLGELNAALAVDLQRLAGAIERQRKLLALIRIRRKARDQRLDLRQQRIAAGIERRPVERRIAIEAVEAVARQHRAERAPAPRRDPWRRDGACNGTQTGPSRPSSRRPLGHPIAGAGPDRISGHRQRLWELWAIMGQYGRQRTCPGRNRSSARFRLTSV